jgi:hypothetical protein
MWREKMADVFIEETTPKAGVVVALVIEKSGPVMKMSIYPGLKALELGIRNLELVQRAIRGLPPAQYESLACEPLLHFLDEGTARWGFETGILSIDCLEPWRARVKVYARQGSPPRPRCTCCRRTFARAITRCWPACAGSFRRGQICPKWTTMRQHCMTSCEWSTHT